MSKNPEPKETAIPRRTRRFWLRQDPPLAPFVWGGLLPLSALACLMLYALLPFARDDIQSAVHDNTRAALDDAGLQWADLSVSGQHVELSGAPPAEADGERALAVARAATCPTWAGRLACAVSVTGDFRALK
jgi:hypothetical protein